MYASTAFLTGRYAWPGPARGLPGPCRWQDTCNVTCVYFSTLAAGHTWAHAHLWRHCTIRTASCLPIRRWPLHVNQSDQKHRKKREESTLVIAIQTSITIPVCNNNNGTHQWCFPATDSLVVDKMPTLKEGNIQTYKKLNTRLEIKAVEHAS